MFDKILQAVLRFFGKEKPEPPTEENNESLEALEKVRLLIILENLHEHDEV